MDRPAEGHDNARRFARRIGRVDGIEVDPGDLETNMVYFEVAGTGLGAPRGSDRLLEHGVRIGPMGEHRMRAVTHLDVDAAGVEETAHVLRVVTGRG